jgi:hypothetical protein
MADIKVNRINRNFRIKVHLYYNPTSFNSYSDATPRFYIKPVELLNIERVAFTRNGGAAKGYTKYGNRFWKWKSDNTLTEAQGEAIYEDIKNSYPYGFLDGDLASENKYQFDVKDNQAFQSYYKTYWENHLSEIKDPEYQPDGSLNYPYRYIEFVTNEIVTYKHNVGVVPPLPSGVNNYSEYGGYTQSYYTSPISLACHDDDIEVTASNRSTSNYFKVDGVSKGLLKLSTSGRYRFDLRSGSEYYSSWPTGAGGLGSFNLSGYRFRFSTGIDGSHNGLNEYTDGVSYVVSPEAGNFYSKVVVKTAVSSPSDDGHPYMYSGHTSGYALSGNGGSATGINVSGFGYDEGATVTLRRDSVYNFYANDASNTGHYMQISTHPSGANSNLYSSGVATSTGLLIFKVPYHAPDKLYYTCKNHSYMGGQINIVDAPSAPYTGSIPGESIIINNTGNADKMLYYYSPDKATMGGYVMLKTGCGGADAFGQY